MISEIKGLLIVVTFPFAFDVQAKTANEVFDTVSASVVTMQTYVRKVEVLSFRSGVVLPDRWGGNQLSCG